VRHPHAGLGHPRLRHLHLRAARTPASAQPRSTGWSPARRAHRQRQGGRRRLDTTNTTAAAASDHSARARGMEGSRHHHRRVALSLAHEWSSPRQKEAHHHPPPPRRGALSPSGCSAPASRRGAWAPAHRSADRHHACAAITTPAAGSRGLNGHTQAFRLGTRRTGHPTPSPGRPVRRMAATARQSKSSTLARSRKVSGWSKSRNSEW
jgi:hypothetical protein